MTKVVMDIGGTNVRCGVLTEKGTLEGDVLRMPVTELGTFASLGSFARACGRLCIEHAGGAPSDIAIGFPGPVDASGQVLAAPTLGLAVDAPDAVLNAFRSVCATSRILLMNDLVAAGHAFVARGYRDFHVLTISSGIGQKIFSEGKPILGPMGWGGELGHVATTGAQLELCDCGGGYHIGAIASGRGILRRVAAAANLEGASFSVLSDELDRRLASGDVEAMTILQICLGPLAQGLATLRMATGISTVFLTGGFVHQFGRHLVQILRAGVAQRCWQCTHLDTLSIEASPTPNDDVLSGLAYLLAR
jgi:C7-cyclitol 7-kinase